MRGALISVMNGVDGSARGGSDDKTEFLSAVETAVAMIVWAEDDFSPIFALVQQWKLRETPPVTCISERRNIAKVLAAPVSDPLGIHSVKWSEPFIWTSQLLP